MFKSFIVQTRLRLKPFLHPHILIGFFILILLSLPFVFTDLDLQISKRFYNSGWIWGETQPWSFLYHYGTIPGLAAGLTFLGLLAASYFRFAWARYRRFAILFLFTLLLGPGLLVNTLGKGYYGRPRPRDVQNFGGNQPFQYLHQPGAPGKGKSFPCGHCSVGFLFTVFFFSRQKRWVRWGSLAAGITWGSALGLARVIQGGHFASDVLWSGGLTYLSAALLHHVILPSGQSQITQSEKSFPMKMGWLGWLGWGALLPLLVFFFLLATPFHKTWRVSLPHVPELQTMTFEFVPGPWDWEWVVKPQNEALSLSADLRGFGLPKANLVQEWDAKIINANARLRLRLLMDRWTTEMSGTIRVGVAPEYALVLIGNTGKGNLSFSQQEGAAPLEKIDLQSSSGNFIFNLNAGALPASVFNLSSQSGMIQVFSQTTVSSLANRVTLGTQKGNIVLAVNQFLPSLGETDWNLESLSGDIFVRLEVSEYLNAGIQWQSQSSLPSRIHAQGNWQTAGNQIFREPIPDFGSTRIRVLTQSGCVDLQAEQRDYIPDSNPAIEETTEPTSQPTATVPPIPWVEKEFIGLR